MFPDDDICSVEAAKNAAQRLFRRYKNRENKEQPSLGKTEVNKLMKATYEAINMPYDPDEQDVFSFMSVFTDNEEQNIQLKDIEEMAVKYLCGIEEGSAGGENKTEVSTLMSVDHSPLPEIQEQEEEKPELGKKPAAISKTEAPGPAPKQLTLELTGTESKSLKKTNAPTKPKATRNAPYSPRNKVPFKQSKVTKSISTSNIKPPASSEIDNGAIFEELVKRGKVIFQRNKDVEVGIGEASAGKTMKQTYEMFGKKHFKPSADDIRVWIKLCDRNADGIVEWDDFKYFLQRNLERHEGVLSLS